MVIMLNSPHIVKYLREIKWIYIIFRILIRNKLKSSFVIFVLFLYTLYQFLTLHRGECGYEMTAVPVKWTLNHSGLFYQYNGVDRDKELPFSSFTYPLEIDLKELIYDIRVYGKTKHKPINIFHYKYTRLPSRGNNKDLFSKNIEILFLIKSPANHLQRRMAIRQTWGNEKVFNKLGGRIFIKRLFLTALPSTNFQKIQLNVDMEDKSFGDILQMTFIDSDFNDTLKTMGGIDWVVKNCPRARFVMLIDDDVIVNTKSLLQYVTTFNHAKHFFTGHLLTCKQPLRRNRPSSSPDKAKTAIPVSRYPFEYYPPFVSSGGTLMSFDVAKDLSTAFPYTKPFIFDNIYIAIINYKLQIVPQENRKFIVEKLTPKDALFHSMLVNHGYGTTYELREAWNILSASSETITSKTLILVSYIITVTAAYYFK